jgi:SSS family solute:Na+ symporter
VWFLSYKMEMASPLAIDIPAYEPRPRLRRDQTAAERERLRALVVTVAVGFGLIVLTALSFGG